MNKELKAQIEKDAEEYAMTEFPLSSAWYGKLKGFKAGAISQNNKSIENIEKFVNKKRAFGLLDANELLEYISSLKITDK